MGGNIVLKMAGELGASAPSHLASVMAICPPIDLAQCSQAMQRGFNRVYDRRFVRSLIKHVAERDALLPDALTRPLVPPPKRLFDFDAVFTAPLSGYRDVHDYYARASSGPLLKQIHVPTLIVTAASDPLVPVAAFERAEYSPSTAVVVTASGGHLGFIAAKSRDPDCRWIDWRIVDWIASRFSRAGSPVAHQTDQRAVEHTSRAVIQLDGAVG
jgi:predicted alpha/beta-fold hydrolase